VEQHSLRPPRGAKRPRKRVGRGSGSGTGTYSGRGIKGQKARGSIRPSFEGGNLPLVRRVPTLRGFKNPTRVEFQAVNLADLEERFEAGATVDAESLAAVRLIDGARDPYKVLARGSISKALTVKAPRLSEAAKEAITAAGGSFEESAPADRTPRNRIHRRRPGASAAGTSGAAASGTAASVAGAPAAEPAASE
jgi:large subunit ribosomal protein L15